VVPIVASKTMMSKSNGLKKFVSCLTFPLIYCTVISTDVVVTYSYKSLPAAEQLNRLTSTDECDVTVQHYCRPCFYTN